MESAAPAPPKKPAPIGADGKPKKLCCSCPETKRARDECFVAHGEAGCADMVEAHKVCLRNEGFDV
jgi:cytochrome c oxidase assembly protein subunit 17